MPTIMGERMFDYDGRHAKFCSSALSFEFLVS